MSSIDTIDTIVGTKSSVAAEGAPGREGRATG
jgi:hypothetical protein